MSKPKTGTYHNCQQCGTPTWVIPARRETFRYCSRKCLAISNHVRKLGAFANVREVICKCGKSFTASGPQPAKYCSDRCYRDALNARRRTGISGAEALLSRWTVVEDKRDKGIRGKLRRRGALKFCVRCSYSEYPQILVVHHVDEDCTNNELYNLVVLCPNCHAIVHRGLGGDLSQLPPTS